VRFVRLFIISIICLFAIVTAVSFFIPSRVRISKAINVKASPASIWLQIDDMGRWKNWNSFFSDVDPADIQRIDSSDGKITGMTIRGTSVSWEKQTPGQRIAAMSREGRAPVLNSWSVLEIEGADSTAVQWYMDFHPKWYPWEKFASLMLEKTYGPRMEKSLGELKKLVEVDRLSQP
jgi:hypothetical protein